jgi:hypothetical protein
MTVRITGFFRSDKIMSGFPRECCCKFIQLLRNGANAKLPPIRRFVHGCGRFFYYIAFYPGVGASPVNNLYLFGKITRVRGISPLLLIY